MFAVAGIGFLTRLLEVAATSRKDGFYGGLFGLGCLVVDSCLR
jgi:hypothetical protein